MSGALSAGCLETPRDSSQKALDDFQLERGLILLHETP